MNGQTAEAASLGRHTPYQFILCRVFIMGLLATSNFAVYAAPTTGNISPAAWKLGQVLGCSITTRVTASGTLESIGATVVSASTGWGCANGFNNSLGYNVYSIGRVYPLQNLIEFNCYSPANLACNFGVTPFPTACANNSTLTGAACTCDTGYMPDSAGTSCIQSCPAHANGSPCTCDKDYEWDATHTSCESTCPEPELTPLTDPVAIDFDNGTRWRPDMLTTDFQTKLACVEKGIKDRGGDPIGTSAYRPTQYQQHLFEIIQKDKKLKPSYMTTHPECQDLRNEISRKMGPPPGHGLRSGQLVATPGTSRHESGTAFDVTPSGLTDAQAAPVYPACSVSHTAVPSEPWHVQ